jgi:hypothetical protein
VTSWEPPPPIKFVKVSKPGYQVRLVGQEGGDRPRLHHGPDSDRHFATLTAARRHACSMVQEILSGSEASLSIEFDVQIWLVGPDGTEQLHDVIVLCAERHMHLRQKVGELG